MADTGSTATASTGGSGPRLLLVAGVLAVFLVPAVLLGVLLLTGSDDEAGEEFSVVVPLGTGERIDAGEDVELMPLEVRLSVGDRMVVENLDDRTHVVGPYTVRPGERLVQRFNEPTVIEGECTLIPEETIRIVVL
jgi:hypothetical protein